MSYRCEWIIVKMRIIWNGSSFPVPCLAFCIKKSLLFTTTFIEIVKLYSHHEKKMAVWIIQWTSVTGFCMTLTSLSSWVTWITRSGGHFLSCSVCVCAKLLHACLTLYDPMDCGWPGSSVQGILQERILRGLPCPPPGNLPNSGIKPESLTSHALTGGFFPIAPPGKAVL